MRHHFPEIDTTVRHRVRDVEVEIPCGGGTHRVVYRAATGRLSLLDHPRLTRRDEWDLAVACGDLEDRWSIDSKHPPTSCFALLAAWRGSNLALPEWMPEPLRDAHTDRAGLHGYRDDARMRQGLSEDAAIHLRSGRARSWLDAWMRNPGDRLARTGLHRMIRHVQGVAETCGYERATEHAVFVIVLTGGRPSIQGARERPQPRNGRVTTETSARVRSTVTARVLPSWMRDVGRHPWVTVQSSGHRCLTVHSWLREGERYAIFGRPSTGHRVLQAFGRVEERNGVWTDVGPAPPGACKAVDRSIAHRPWSPFIARMGHEADRLFPQSRHGEPPVESEMFWADYSDLARCIVETMPPEERKKLLGQL